MNVYGDVGDDRMKEAHGRIAALVFTSTRREKRTEQAPEDHAGVGSAEHSS